jgi:hypothetical protein
MTTTSEVEAELFALLPPPLRTQASRLSRLLINATKGIISLSQLQSSIETDVNLALVPYVLAGKHIVIDRGVVAFEADDRVGQIRVGEIVYGSTLSTRQVYTDGGNYAEGNIDNRRGVFIGSGAIVKGPVFGVNWGKIDIISLPSIDLPQEFYQPPEISGFIRRDADLDYFKEQLVTSHLAIIMGMPGTGKTWLATLLVREMSLEKPKKIFWYKFREHDTFDVIIRKMAISLAHNP